jgi:cytochrome c6
MCKILCMTRMALVVFFFAAALRADSLDPAASFKTNCAACHGADGRGQGPMGKALHVKDLASDDVQAQSDQDLKKIIAEGKGKMPAYKGKLADADIAALVTFIRSLRPAK